MRAYDIARPPLDEHIRFFMTQGMGLFLARQKLERSGLLDREDHEFVVRNTRKTQLAFGVSVLFLEGCYSPSYVKRCSLFRSLDIEHVRDWKLMSMYYEEAMDFKLGPTHDRYIGDALHLWERCR